MALGFRYAISLIATSLGVATAAAEPADFARASKLLETACQRCHLGADASAGFDISRFSNVASLATQRVGWESVVARLRAREMPPPDDNELSERDRRSLIEFVEGELERSDRQLAPDPGRVPIRRLNRVEYANTIRDLLGIDIAVTDEFPPDDSGYGFDNVGDVLAVSPFLMQRYLAVAERIASRVVGAGDWPRPGVFTQRSAVREIGEGAIELRHVFEYDAEYELSIGVIGSRTVQDPPQTLGVFVDGRLAATFRVPTAPSAFTQKAHASQRVSYTKRLVLPQNAHAIRVAFINDTGLAKIPRADRAVTFKNIFPEYLDVAGPFRPVAQPPRHPALVCDPAGGETCARRILAPLVRRAFRRPVGPDEITPFVRIYTTARANGYSPARSLAFALTAILVSPHFLLRIEREPAAGQVARVSDVELASRLSYFLWSSMPDERLLRLGETGVLHDPAVLRGEVTRMLRDRKARAFSDNFGGQWLETRSLEAATRDATRFPEWRPELADAMRVETQLFLHAMVRDNRPLHELIDGRYTYINSLLAEHYGIPDVRGVEFRRVPLTGAQRSGVFTQGSVLTVSSYPTRTSVVLRGKFLLDNVLDSPPPPPPANIPTLDDSAAGVARSHRDQLERHRADPQCASCHDKLDPLGFGLENYDAIGRWRLKDGPFSVDASGTFPGGQTFRGPRELKALLRRRLPAFTRVVAERMLIYALGRGIDPYDRIVVKQLVRQTVADQLRIQTLIQGIVASYPFQHRRGEARP